MVPYNKTLALVFLAVIVFSIPALAQDNDCYAAFGSDNIPYVDRDGTQLITQELYMDNRVCKVGGFQLRIYTEPFGALEPVGIDTVGSRISGWESVGTYTNREEGYLQIFALADLLYSGGHTPPADTGIGMVCKVIFQFGCAYNENIQVQVNIDSVLVADSTGYILFDNVGFNNSTIYIGDDVTPIDRGDANCDGRLIGSDVTYMVSYFRGLRTCPCSLCAGDANGDGRIIGSDVTYMVQYFAGNNPLPGPCTH
jgi:hypothetical protein